MNATAFDWEKVREKLAHALLGNWDDPKHIEKVYSDRAERYAQRDLEKKHESDERWLMVPFLEGHLAIPLPKVSEVTRSLPLTEVPGSPDELLGFISFQGEAVPVLDPWALCRKPRPPSKDEGFTILLRKGMDRIGLAVSRIDSLQTISEYSEQAWAQCPALNQYFRAWGADGVIILDAESLISAYL